MEAGQTWIRRHPHKNDRAVTVWVCLEGNVMLCIRQNGEHFVTADAEGYLLDRGGEGDIFIERIS